MKSLKEFLNEAIVDEARLDKEQVNTIIHDLLLKHFDKYKVKCSDSELEQVVKGICSKMWTKAMKLANAIDRGEFDVETNLLDENEPSFMFKNFHEKIWSAGPSAGYTKLLELLDEEAKDLKK